MSDYPEHEKLAKRRDELDVVQQFIDFVRDHEGFALTVDPGRDSIQHGRLYVPVLDVDCTRLVGEYFDIDDERFQEERDRMLAELGNG